MDASTGDTSGTKACDEPKEPPNDCKDDEEDDVPLEDLELYQLDYEREPIAGGGEILQAGDHVYMWCTLYQHHGIVMDVAQFSTQKHIVIAEFTNQALETATTIFTSTSASSGATSGNGVSGGFRMVQEFEPSKWHKVKYLANPVECMTWRPGTCSSATPSSLTTIIRRVEFLRDCRHWLPEYHLLASNCETVAVWCRTGKWETMQGHAGMKWSAVGAAGAFSAVPVVGWVAGAALSGAALWHRQQIGSRWNETEARLNQEFQWYAMGKPSRSTTERKSNF